MSSLCIFQFYLEDHILEVTSLASEWPLEEKAVLNWGDVENLGKWESADRQMQSEAAETYLLLRMRANSKSYDRLHKRVLEV